MNNVQSYKSQLWLRIYGVTAGFLSYSAIFSVIMNLFLVINRSGSDLSGLGYTITSWLLHVIYASQLASGLKTFFAILVIIGIAAIFLTCYLFARKGYFIALLVGAILYLFDFLLIAIYGALVTLEAGVLLSLIIIHSLFTIIGVISFVFYFLILKHQKIDHNDHPLNGPHEGVDK